MKGAAQFYTNRVLKDFKDKDPVSVDWTKAWIEVIAEMQKYVKQWHTSGLAWNPKGGDAKAASGWFFLCVMIWFLLLLNSLVDSRCSGPRSRARCRCCSRRSSTSSGRPTTTATATTRRLSR